MHTATWRILTRYTTLYYISLTLLIASLPLSKFTMSVFQFLTLFAWLRHGVNTAFLSRYNSVSLLNPLNFIKLILESLREIWLALIKKFVVFFHNRAAVVFTSLLLLHAIGLLYTSDFDYALKDLRIKLPILILPLFIATGPKISNRLFFWIMAAYATAVVGGSIYRLVLFLNLPVADSRALSAHTSHIRYSLNAVFAIFILFFFLKMDNIKAVGIKILILIVSIWLTAFLFYMSYTTGMVLFVILCLFSLFYLISKIRKKALRIMLFTATIIILLLPVIFLFKIGDSYSTREKINFANLDKYTPRGNSYYHDTVNFRSQNGKWLGLYICDKELRQAWALRSTFSLDSLDPKLQVRRFTLIRYLASKDLRKDADGIKALTDADIKNIEQGINRYNFGQLPGLSSQIEDFKTSYTNYINKNDPNSGSLVQRFEYWRTTFHIIAANPLFGVGTGDLPEAFNQQYIKMKSNLASQFRLRSHNQYLAITVAFGIVGLIWFLLVLFYPGIKTRGFNNYFYIVFWLILMFSMLTEDTIETQEGATFFAVFTALLLFGRETPGKQETLYSENIDN